MLLDFMPTFGMVEDQPISEFVLEDRLHLAAPGYLKWGEMLSPLLAKTTGKSDAPPAVSATNNGVEVSLGDGGIEIDAGSFGKFTLGYPALFGTDQKLVRKIVDRNITKLSATLSYEGSLKLGATLEAGGTVRLKFSDAPAEVTSLQWDMHIPISFNQGGKWKIDAKEGRVPKRTAGQAASLSGKWLHPANHQLRGENSCD